MKTYIYTVRDSKLEAPTEKEIKAVDAVQALNKALALHQGKRIKLKGLKI